MSKVKTVDFSGQTIFVGLDVHLNNWSVYGILDGREVVRESKDPDSDKVMSSLKARFPGAYFSFVYEAGFCGFGICRRLRELGASCIVVNAADIPTSDKDRKTKTDKRDARKLAQEHSKGTLKGVNVPDPQIESMRSLVRHREELVKMRTASVNRLKQFLYSHDINIGEKIKRFNKKNIAALRAKLTGQPALDLTLKYLLNEYEQLREWVKEVTLEIRRLSRQEPRLKEVQEILQTVDGIGLITAMTIQTELVDMTRFKSTDQLCSYIGLVPDINSSGDRSAKCAMTRRANKYLKKGLIEASWTAIRKDPALRYLYNNYIQRMPANKAIVRIAKHLILRVKAVWLKMEPYQRGVITSKPAIAA